jgi:hypothetical protein
MLTGSHLNAHDKRMIVAAVSAGGGIVESPRKRAEVYRLDDGTWGVLLSHDERDGYGRTVNRQYRYVVSAG